MHAVELLEEIEKRTNWCYIGRPNVSVQHIQSLALLWYSLIGYSFKHVHSQQSVANRYSCCSLMPTGIWPDNHKIKVLRYILS